jgi:hypothetical protein
MQRFLPDITTDSIKASSLSSSERCLYVRLRPNLKDKLGNTLEKSSRRLLDAGGVRTSNTIAIAGCRKNTLEHSQPIVLRRTIPRSLLERTLS